MVHRTRHIPNRDIIDIKQKDNKTKKEKRSMHQFKRIRGWDVMLVAVLLIIGCTSMVFAGSAGEVLDDSIITTKIKSSFVADPTVSVLDIGVETSNGIVNLSGTVNSEQERQRAIQLAQGVDGVKGVNFRNLIVKR